MPQGIARTGRPGSHRRTWQRDVKNEGTSQDFIENKGPKIGKCCPSHDLYENTWVMLKIQDLIENKRDKPLQAPQSWPGSARIGPSHDLYENTWVMLKIQDLIENKRDKPLQEPPELAGSLRRQDKNQGCHWIRPCAGGDLPVAQGLRCGPFSHKVGSGQAGRATPRASYFV
jgi:hypothetical protein